MTEAGEKYRQLFRTWLYQAYGMEREWFPGSADILGHQVDGARSVLDACSTAFIERAERDAADCWGNTFKGPYRPQQKGEKK